MNKSFSIFCALFFSFLGSGTALADDPTGDYFGHENLICKDTSSTITIYKCEYEDLEKSDKALNIEYQELLKIASAEERNLLRRIQQTWMAMRDAECDLYQYYRDEKRVPNVWRTRCLGDVTRRRVVELKQLSTGIVWRAEWRAKHPDEHRDNP